MARISDRADCTKKNTLYFKFVLMWVPVIGCMQERTYCLRMKLTLSGFIFEIVITTVIPS